MYVNFSQLILWALVATFIAACTPVPPIHAQSSGPTQTGCMHGMAEGLICISNPPTHSLPIRKWHAQVNGIDAILTISCEDKACRTINGTLAGGNGTCAIGGMPCEIRGTFDNTTGKITFLATSTYRPSPPSASFVPPVQNYTGIESENVMPDNSFYWINGVGRTIRPVIGPEFGWSASMFCGFAGCIG
jgi:hypothetical protein